MLVPMYIVLFVTLDGLPLLWHLTVLVPLTGAHTSIHWAGLELCNIGKEKEKVSSIKSLQIGETD